MWLVGFPYWLKGRKCINQILAKILEKPVATLTVTNDCRKIKVFKLDFQRMIICL